MNRFLLILVLLLTAQKLFAEPVEAKLSWTPPTTYVDGSPLSSSDIAGYRVYHEVDGEVTEASDSVDIPNGESYISSIDLTPREDPYLVNYRVKVFLHNGAISEFSNNKTKSFQIKSSVNPNEPVRLLIKITCINNCTIREAKNL